ncbi:MAG: Rieske (2Fe-2S) protein [Chloroflexota bacterium]|nr:Rieske (2Fe-2S) protein [Chloroflexota bacterium]
MGRHVVGRVTELPAGERRIVEAEGRSIGVFNVHGRYYALRNSCPHQAAPLCLGPVKGMALPTAPGEYAWAREGEILRCPWHGWEFDITNGRSIFNPHKTRVKTYEVTVEADGGAPKTGIDAESVETYAVTVEDGLVVLHV